ncbi:MAG: 4-hydroxybutyrate CoA-transferase [Actinomycetia bacterium]|nr:4-hydroxybutyrate CoA-transferase [Actinomycetes bacterium]
MAKTVDSPAEAVAALGSADVLALGLGPAHPPAFLHALGDRDDWVDLQVFGALLTDLYSIFTQPNVRYRSGFYGPAERFLRDSGADIDYVPADFRRFGPIVQQLAPRVMATAAAPPDADGKMSLSLHAGATVDELHRCAADPDRLLIVEYSEHFPRTLGLPPEHTHSLSLDEVDIAFESEGQPVNLPDAAGSDADRVIAGHARAFIPDGATLQTGIGAIPSLIATLLAEGPGGGYGVHSEMFTNGLMKLHEAGKVTNSNKGEYDGYSITTFAAGTPELYTWLDGNPEVRFLPVDIVNDARKIAANHHFVSINGATAVDLYGQVAADTIGGQQHSGTGGHEDFLAGAGLRVEDRSLLCLRSSSVLSEGRASRITGNLAPEMTVTTPRHQVDVIITEYGTAELSGLTVTERAQALVAIAHPDFRSELSEAAERIGQPL